MPPGTSRAAGPWRRTPSRSWPPSAAGPGSGGSGCGCRRTPSWTRRRDAFDLPELAIADARNKHDRPKVERHEGCLLTVVPTARYVDEREEVEFGELFFYAGPDYIVTVRYGHAAPLAGVRHELEDDSDRLAHGPGAVLQAALLHVVQSYVPVIDGLEHDVREIERAVFSERREQPTKRIYFLSARCSTSSSPSSPCRRRSSA